MSSITPNPNPAAGTEQPAMLSPEEVVRQLRSLRQHIPMPTPTPAPASLRRRLAHVRPDFVQAAVNAVGSSEVAQQALGRSDEDLRLEIDAAARWTAVTDELRGLLQAIEVANALRRQRIGLAALQTYQFCVQLARDDSHARLRTHIAEMKRLKPFGRRRRKPVDPEVVAEPKVEVRL